VQLKKALIEYKVSLEKIKKKIIETKIKRGNNEIKVLAWKVYLVLNSLFMCCVGCALYES